MAPFVIEGSYVAAVEMEILSLIEDGVLNSFVCSNSTTKLFLLPLLYHGLNLLSPKLVQIYDRFVPNYVCQTL